MKSGGEINFNTLALQVAGTKADKAESLLKGAHDQFVPTDATQHTAFDAEFETVITGLDQQMNDGQMVNHLRQLRDGKSPRLPLTRNAGDVAVGASLRDALTAAKAKSTAGVAPVAPAPAPAAPDAPGSAPAAPDTASPPPPAPSAKFNTNFLDIELEGPNFIETSQSAAHLAEGDTRRTTEDGTPICRDPDSISCDNEEVPGASEGVSGNGELPPGAENGMRREGSVRESSGFAVKFRDLVGLAVGYSRHVGHGVSLRGHAMFRLVQAKAENPQISGFSRDFAEQFALRLGIDYTHSSGFHARATWEPIQALFGVPGIPFGDLERTDPGVIFGTRLTLGPGWCFLPNRAFCAALEGGVQVYPDGWNGANVGGSRYEELDLENHAVVGVVLSGHIPVKDN